MLTRGFDHFSKNLNIHILGLILLFLTASSWWIIIILKMKLIPSLPQMIKGMEDLVNLFFSPGRCPFFFRCAGVCSSHNNFLLYS